MPPHTSKTKSLVILGILGILSLVVPWYYLDARYSMGTRQYTLSWHLFDWIWQKGSFPGHFVTIADFPLDASVLPSIGGFILALAGSLLLLFGKKVGGILLVADAIMWVIQFYGWMPSLVWTEIPIGALMSGIVGLVSLVYRK
jgi:hypothetical protein